MSPIARLSLIAAASLVGGTAAAQIEYGGEPPSTYHTLSAQAPTATMRTVDVPALLEEDAAQQGKGPFRFGDNLEVDLGFEAGVWEALPNGDRVWRLRVESTGAYSISFILSEYELPSGAELYVYNDDMSSVYGMYNYRNNKPNGQMAIQPLQGEAVTLEYFEPTWVDFEGRLRIGTVVHDYRDVLAILAGSSSSPADGSCEIDVACPQGVGWEQQIRAVTRILNGGSLCSGSLLNNTAFDGTQLYMSANHCGSMNNAIFHFKHQKPACGSGVAPSNFSVQGSTLLANSSGLDFRLIRILPTIPANYEPFYAGWNRSGAIPSNTVTIHHPGGQPKKISFDNNSPVKSGTQWRILQWDLGVTQGGSSGCPLYDPNGRFLGQLCCGAAFCGFPFDDFYGRMDTQWGQVAAHLDPLGTGQTVIDGFDPFSSPAVLSGLSPMTVPAFASGQVTLTGSGFGGTSAVHVGGTTLTSFTVVDDSTLTFSAPTPTALGPVSVTVEKAVGMSNAVTLTYVETDPALLSATAASLTGLTVAWNFGAGADDLWFLFVSVNDNSTLPFGGFDLLANGVFLSSGTLSAVGVGNEAIIVPGGLAGAAVYSQVVTLDGGSFGLEAATNIGTTSILF
ncbi:MAG: IPT/TIG domain-containing protein [Planctomycetota bacterium]